MNEMNTWQPYDVVSGRWTRHAVKALEATGVDVSTLCIDIDIGLDYDTLTDGFAIIERRLVARLWLQAVVQYQDPDLGLHALERYRPVADDMSLHLLISCETLGDGMEQRQRELVPGGGAVADQDE